MEADVDTDAIREHVMPLLRDAEKHMMRGDRAVGFDAALHASMQAGRVAHNLAMRRRMHAERQYDTLCICASILLTRPGLLTDDAVHRACDIAMQVSDIIADVITGGTDATETSTGETAERKESS